MIRSYIRQWASALRLFVLWTSGVLIVMSLGHGASAQKYPGETIPTAPPRYSPPVVAPRPPVAAMVVPPSAPAAPPAVIAPEADGEARQLAERLPLDPSTRNLQSRLPADVPGTIRRLHLRVHSGPHVDLRNTQPTRTEIVNALAH